MGRKKKASIGYSSLNDRFAGLTHHYPITEFIPIGKENAWHLMFIAGLAELAEETARNQISRARDYRLVAYSPECGYWLPDDEPTEEEIKAIRNMIQRYNNSINTLKAHRNICIKWLESHTPKGTKRGGMS